jgi:hypothetical protein
MAINEWIKKSNIDAEKAEVLNRAFEYALEELGLVDRDDALTDILSRKKLSRLVRPAQVIPKK